MNLRGIKFFCTLMMATYCGMVFAVQAPNPRSGTNVSASTRSDGRGATVSDGGATSRAATRRGTTTVARTASTTNTAARVAVPVTSVRGNANTARVATAKTATVRSATVGATARTAVGTSSARSATNTSRAALSRAASSARATAVFNDVSKIGSGYSQCREAYATCMDQFCANANDTYRRCFCSDKFIEFRNTETAFDEAKDILARFENNNLTAVNLTAEEVNAMYSATEGENAIKSDTSAASQMLSEIGDLLSGKAKPKATTQSGINPSGLMDVNFSNDIDDIWGDNGSSFFSSNTATSDLTALEGAALYNSANDQCLQIISDSCENSAVLNMARSSYSILITQDCNAYEKKIDSDRQTIEKIVRTAEKYLREARLEEYQSHNSADVNDCIASVKTAMSNENACGANYSRCLDPTGLYVVPSTGEVIYSSKLHELTSLITLSGNMDSDILLENRQFNSFLDEKKMYAESALDTCRDISATVWEEFKRSAIIEIAQAQAAKIEEVKMSCVSTMAQCYDTQSNALKDFDTNTAKVSGALSAYAAKEMCRDQVTACAALYGDPDGCDINSNTGKVTAKSGKVCGMAALISFVDSVDNVRVAEGCATAIDTYIKSTCTPTTGDKGFPYNCRSYDANEIRNLITEFASQNCINAATGQKDLDASVKAQVEKSIKDLQEELEYQLGQICEDLDGYWVDAVDTESATGSNPLTAFYSAVYPGANQNYAYGRCVENTTRIRCLSYNDAGKEPVATYDRAKDECIFTSKWYEERCGILGGYYESGNCYVPK